MGQRKFNGSGRSKGASRVFTYAHVLIVITSILTKVAKRVRRLARKPGSYYALKIGIALRLTNEIRAFIPTSVDARLSLVDCDTITISNA